MSYDCSSFLEVCLLLRENHCHPKPTEQEIAKTKATLQDPRAKRDKVFADEKSEASASAASDDRHADTTSVMTGPTASGIAQSINGLFSQYENTASTKHALHQKTVKRTM